MAKNKGPRILVTLECIKCSTNNMKISSGISRYITIKNRKNTPNKLELFKYCKHCNTHYIHKEIK